MTKDTVVCHPREGGDPGTSWAEARNTALLQCILASPQMSVVEQSRNPTLYPRSRVTTAAWLSPPVALVQGREDWLIQSEVWPL